MEVAHKPKMLERPDDEQTDGLMDTQSSDGIT